jgi:hypothetical protein
MVSKLIVLQLSSLSDNLLTQLHQAVSEPPILEPNSHPTNSEPETTASSVEEQPSATEASPGSQSSAFTVALATDTHDEATPKVSKFFMKFVEAGFVPDPLATFDGEFERLSLLMGWERKRKRDEHDSERTRHLHRASESEFATHCGTVDDLTSWQALCGMLAVEPVPSTIETYTDVRWRHSDMQRITTLLIRFTLGAAQGQRVHHVSDWQPAHA